MATVSESQSLNEINYRPKSRLGTLAVLVIAFFLFLLAFLRYFPVGSFIRSMADPYLRQANCRASYDDVDIGLLLPRLVVTNVTIPASCLGGTGEPIQLSHLTINYQLINFAPFGLPFRVDTELSGQPLSIHYVLGFGDHMVRLKDQALNLSRLQPILLPQFRLGGTVTVDLTARMDNQAMKSFNLIVASRNFEIPAQTIEALSLNVPNLRINNLKLLAHATGPQRIVVDDFVIGDENSPLLASFKGRVDLQAGNIAFSPLDLRGELAVSEQLRADLGLLDMLLAPYPKTDRHHQIRISGTLASPKGSAP
jgi:type II secretion system protein N